MFLECVWETDKFVLVERKSELDNKNPEATNVDVICKEGLSTVEYQSIETILGGKQNSLCFFFPYIFFKLQWCNIKKQNYDML